MTTGRTLNKLHQLKQLNAADMGNLIERLRDEYKTEIIADGELDLPEDKDPSIGFHLLQGIMGKRFFTINKKSQTPSLESKRSQAIDLPGKKITVVDMAKDSETSRPENLDAALFYVADVIAAAQKQAESGLLLIPLMQCRGVLKIPNKWAKRRHAVLLEVDLDKKTLNIHDWRSARYNTMYPDKLIEIAKSYGFSHSYNSYDTQDKDHMSYYYVHNGIISILKNGNSAHLSNLVITPRIIKSKEYYLDNWSTISKQVTRVPLPAVRNQGYRTKAQRIKRVVAWDFDVVINNVGRFVNTKIHPQQKIYCSPFETKKDVSSAVKKFDIVIDNVEFLQLTLDILQDNGVQSVCASQRLTYSQCPEEKEDVYLLKNHMQASLTALSRGRDYFKKDEEVEKAVAQRDLRNNKNLLLSAHLDSFAELHRLNPERYKKLSRADIMLVDDRIHYKQCAERSGYQFLHVVRADDPYKDSAYLYEVLIRNVSIDQIYESMDSLVARRYAGKDAVTRFKQCFLQYQLENLDKVAMAQLGCANPTTAEDNAKNILLGMRHVILKTSWKIGWFGGQEIYIKHANGSYQLVNTVPKNMRVILEIIRAAEQSQNWQDALQRIKTLAGRARDEGEHYFWNRRGKTTSLFYRMIAQSEAALPVIAEPGNKNSIQ